MLHVKKLYNSLYLITFDDHYQLCMHFMRFQEYYESPKFRGENFEIVDLMEWYAKKYGKGVFTYPKDWAGFNLPGSKILELEPKDLNRYDRLMKSIAEYIKADVGDEDFYIIGTTTDSKLDTIKHEIAHGLYYVESDYECEMNYIYKNLPERIKERIENVLTNMCYNESVMADEIQAYMATGLLKEFGPQAKKYQEPFKEVFDRYSKTIKV